MIRGTSHSISSLAEDLFAKYCADLLERNSRTQVLIDPQISFKISGLKNKSGKRPLLVRPDICFLKDNEVTKIFDIKTDLGYKRKEIINQAGDLKKLVSKIKGKNATVNLENEERKIRISKTLQEFIVVVSGAENSGNIKETKAIIQRKHKIIMLILAEGDHLNTYKPNPKFKLTSDFNSLDSFIRK